MSEAGWSHCTWGYCSATPTRGRVDDGQAHLPRRCQGRHDGGEGDVLRAVAPGFDEVRIPNVHEHEGGLRHRQGHGELASAEVLFPTGDVGGRAVLEVAYRQVQTGHGWLQGWSYLTP